MDNIKNDDFYRGYAARDKVAKEICSKCTYMKKDRQQNKTYKGMLQKQNKIIDAMAETIIEDTDKLGTFWCNGCEKLSKCPYKDIKQCVREHFESKIKESK